MKKLTPIVMAILLATLACTLVLPNAAYAGKPRIAVSRMEFKSEGYDWSTGRAIGSEVADIMIRNLVNSGRFEVVSKDKVDQIIAEDLKNRQNTNEDNPQYDYTKMYSLCDYVVEGRITDFRQGGGGGGVSVWGIGGVGGSRQTANVTVEFSIVSTKDAHVVFAERGVGEKHGKSSFSISTSQGSINKDEFENSLVGAATQLAVEDCTTKIVGYFPMEGTIVAIVDPTTLIIDLGQNSGLKVGDELTVYHVQDIKDSKGNVQFTKREPIGKIKISEFQLDKSLCKVVTGCVGVAEGDVAQPVNPPGAPKKEDKKEE